MRPGQTRLPPLACVPLLLAWIVIATSPAAAQEHTHGHGNAEIAPAAEREGHGEHGDIVAYDAGRIEIRHDPGAHELTALLGPYRIPATGNTMRLTAAEVVVVPIDGWITRFRTRIVDHTGSAIAPEVLHHINVVRPDRRELFFPVMQRLAAAGRETGEISTPFPFGVPIAAGDTLLISVMLHNPTGQPVEFLVEARFHYDTPAWLDRLVVEPFHLDIRPPPMGASFDLPPGRSELTWEGSPAIDTRVVALGGHMHAYGVELRLEELRPDGTPAVLFTTRPEVDDDGRVARIPRKTFLLRRLRLAAARTYRLVAIYDNPTGRVIPGGGMAEIGGVARPLGSWPDADHADPWFHADYAHFTRHNPALSVPATSSPSRKH